MDPKTLRVLEYDKIVARLAGHAAFDVGRELALALRPSADAVEVRARQAVTREARAFADRRDGATLEGAQDVRAAVAGAARGRVLQPAELLAVRATLAVARRLKRAIAHDDARWPGLAALAGRIDPCPAVHDAIGEALDEAGEVLDSASPELRRVRRQLKVVHDRIARQLQALVKGAAREYLQDALVTQRNGRWVVPLKADFRSRVPGVVHDRQRLDEQRCAAVGRVVDNGNAHRELTVEEQREVERVLRALSEAVAVEADAIAETVAALGDLDLAFAAARYGRELRAVTPEIVDAAAPMLRCEAARHPLLDGATVVPIGVRIGDDFRLMVITGPNTGGKTVTLKTVGLLALMAQAGLQVPCADGAQLAVFDAVYADIGDEQSIEQSLSTFSGHLTNIVRILHDATPRSLVLLDELGAGTDPTEGAALAGAILEALRARGVATVASSHFTELKAYAYGTPGVANASVEFDLETLRPTYELTIGLPGRSNALAIAERLGLPGAIVEAARGGLATSEVEMEELLADIRAARRSAIQDRAAATEQRQTADRWAAELEEGVDRLAAERAAVLQTTRAQAQDELEAAREAIARLLKRAERAAALARAGTVVVEAPAAGAPAAGAPSAAELAAERAEILGGLAKIEDILTAESVRPGGEQRCLVHHALALVEHAAPARRGRLRAQAKVAQRRLGEDGDGEADRRLHDQHRGNVRQHVLERDSPGALAAGACGEHELARPHRVGRGPRDACELRDVEDADRHDGGHQPRPEDRRQHDRGEQRREGDAEVRQAHHQLLHPAAPRRGEQAERHAHRDADAHGDQAHGDGGACADDEQRDDVAPQAVGAQPVRRRGRQQLVRHVDLGGGVRRPHERQQCQHDQRRDQHAAGDEAAVAQRALPEAHEACPFRRGSITA